MSNRIEDARKLAEARPELVYYECLGIPPHPGFVLDEHTVILIPAADAPLHEQMEFVGRIAEALPPCKRVSYLGDRNRLHVVTCTGALWFVQFFDEDGRVGVSASASDLAHAAILAALAAKGAS